MAAYCERQLRNGEWCIKVEHHRGPHIDHNRRTNAQNARNDEHTDHSDTRVCQGIGCKYGDQDGPS